MRSIEGEINERSCDSLDALRHGTPNFRRNSNVGAATLSRPRSARARRARLSSAHRSRPPNRPVLAAGQMRIALARLLLGARTCCSWTNRPTTSIWRRPSGSKTTSRPAGRQMLIVSPIATAWTRSCSACSSYGRVGSRRSRPATTPATASNARPARRGWTGHRPAPAGGDRTSRGVHRGATRKARQSGHDGQEPREKMLARLDAQRRRSAPGSGGSQIRRSRRRPAAAKS